MDSKITPEKFINCDIISYSLAQIVRFSANEKFRKNCYRVLAVDSTKVLEEKLYTKFSNMCGENGAYQTKKIAIKSAEIALTSDEEEITINFQPEPIQWLFGATNKRKRSLKRRASIPFLNADKENTPVKFLSQPFERKENFQDVGKVARTLLTTPPDVATTFLYKSPSRRFLENAINCNQPNTRDRTLDVPEKTRKFLFFDEIPVTSLFE